MTEHERAAEQFSDGPSLTERDRELIRLQCEIQSATSPEQIAGMTAAFEQSKRLAYQYRDVSLGSGQVADVLFDLGAKVEPGRPPGLRTTPVTFANGSSGEHPDRLPRAMTSWAEAYAEDRLEPDEAYEIFERNHPLEDGNGRVGHCFWAIAKFRQEKHWPTQLPPNIFGESRPDGA